MGTSGGGFGVGVSVDGTVGLGEALGVGDGVGSAVGGRGVADSAGSAVGETSGVALAVAVVSGAGEASGSVGSSAGSTVGGSVGSTSGAWVGVGSSVCAGRAKSDSRVGVGAPRTSGGVGGGVGVPDSSVRLRPKAPIPRQYRSDEAMMEVMTRRRRQFGGWGCAPGSCSRIWAELLPVVANRWPE